MITALSMISIVVESTILHRVGISSLTKTRPGTEDLDRNGSMYVDFPKVAMISGEKAGYLSTHCYLFASIPVGSFTWWLEGSTPPQPPQPHVT